MLISQTSMAVCGGGRGREEDEVDSGSPTTTRGSRRFGTRD